METWVKPAASSPRHPVWSEPLWDGNLRKSMAFVKLLICLIRTIVGWKLLSLQATLLSFQGLIRTIVGWKPEDEKNNYPPVFFVWSEPLWDGNSASRGPRYCATTFDPNHCGMETHVGTVKPRVRWKFDPNHCGMETCACSSGVIWYQSVWSEPLWDGNV